MSIVAIVTIGGLLAGTPSDECASDRPPLAETAKLVTEDAGPVDPGNIEVELGYRLGGAKKQYQDQRRVIERGTLIEQIFALKVTRGFTARLDAAVEVAWRNLIQDDEKELAEDSGFVAANLKWNFYESNARGVALSWIPGFSATYAGPLPDELIFAPGQAFWSIDNVVVLTVPGEAFNCSFDAGYQLPVGNQRADDRGVIFANAAFGYQIRPWFQPVVELNYGHGFVIETPDSESYALTAGAVLNLSDTVRLDAGLQQVIDGRNADKLTGLIINFSVTP